MSSEGALVLVVGPSGAGKDSLLRFVRNLVREDMRIRFARRYITRPADANEDNFFLKPDEFGKARELGGFMLSWDAHGLSYGIPASLAIDLARGVLVVANVSRTIVDAARAAWPHTFVVFVTAPPEMLERRVKQRNRDTDADTRLSRATASDDSLADLTIVNDGELQDAAAQFLKFLEMKLKPAPLASQDDQSSCGSEGKSGPPPRPSIRQ